MQSTDEFVSRADFSEGWGIIMKLRYHFGLLHRAPILIAVATLLAAVVGCESSATTPSPSTANVAGTWVLQIPAEPAQTTMVLNQDGPVITGTWSRTAESLTTTGTVAGTVSRDQFTLRADLVSRDNNSTSCATSVTGVLIVSADSLSGSMSSVPQPPCSGRAATLPYSWRRLAQ